MMHPHLLHIQQAPNWKPAFATRRKMIFSFTQVPGVHGLESWGVPYERDDEILVIAFHTTNQPLGENG